MYHQLFFGASCVGILMAAGLMPLPERENLPEFSIPEISLSDMSLPDAPTVMASVGAFVEDLPEMRESFEETVVRPTVNRVVAAVQRSDTPAVTKPRPQARPLHVTEKVVHFDLDRDQLDDIARETLDRLAVQLQDRPDARLGVFGHTDLTGEEGYNKTLGQSRAEQVSAYLQRNGVAPDRIEIIKSYGETAPLVATDAPLRENRRVLIEILTTGNSA